MSNNADAVNDKINGLVSLLKAVGVDGGPNGSGKTLDEAQIQNIIRKLQTAQAEAPQIIAALEAHAKNRKAPQHQPPPQHRNDGDFENEEEEDEEEEDDEGNYPMVGPGCSDDVSVMSDLTTPTVVSSLHVPEEEQYKETLPPMIVGSMLIAPTKRKNLVNTNRGLPRKSNAAGGAAAQRRKHYNATMEKLGDPKKPQHHPSKPSQPTVRKSSEKTGRRNSTGAKANDWGDQWNAFDSAGTGSTKSATLIDDDGFLMNGNGDAGFSDAFNPFQEQPAFTKTVKKVPKKSKEKSSSKSKGSVGSSGGSATKRRPRRASLAM